MLTLVCFSRFRAAGVGLAAASLLLFLSPVGAGAASASPGSAGAPGSAPSTGSSSKQTGESQTSEARSHSAQPHDEQTAPSTSAQGRGAGRRTYQVLQRRADRLVVRLPNRMIVIAQRNPAEPVVSVQTWVKTGSIYEQQQPGAGLSHFLEHLLAGGTTTTRTEAQSNQLLGQIGASTNAATGLSTVHYYINTTAEHTARAVDLLSDWLRHAKITPREYRRERQVIQKELSMDRGEPGRVLWTLTQRARYQAHPARYPTIGYLNRFLKITRPQIIDFYHRMYVPNNMVFVVVGDIQPGKVVEQVARRWGGAPAKKLPALSFPVEPKIQSPRTLTAHAAIHQLRLRLAWPGTRLGGEGDYALDLLASILGQGESSRLVRQVRARPGSKVTSIDAYNLSFSWGRGFVGIDSEIKPGAVREAGGKNNQVSAAKAEQQRIEKAKQAMLEQVARLRNKPVTADELARAKRKVLVRVTLGSQTVQGMASRLARDTITMGDPDYLAKYARAIQKLTPADLQAAAKRFLKPDRLITVKLLPGEFKPMNHPSPAPAAAHLKHVPVKLDNRQLLDELRHNLEGPHERTPVVQVGKVRQFTLDNDLRVIVQRSTVTPGVAMQMYWKGGLLASPPGREGIANAAARMMTRGTKTRSAQQIAAAVGDLGASLQADSGNSTAFVRARSLAEDWPKVMSIMADVVLHPTFPKKQWRRLKPRLLGAIQNRDDTWSGELQKDFRKAYFGDHPWASTPLGEPKVIRSLTAADLQRYHDRHMGAGKTVLVVVGDVDPAKVKQEAGALFGDMPRRAEQAFTPPKAAAPRAQVVQDPTNKPVAAVQIGFGPGLVRANPDYARVRVLSTVMSDFPSGWLDQQLRGKGPGLVYAVGAYMQTGLSPGYFGVLFNTQPSQVVQAVKRTMGVVRRARQGPISDQALRRAKAKVLTREFFGRQSNADRAAELALDQLYHVDDPYARRFKRKVKAMSGATVKEMAHLYLRDPVAVVLTGKPVDSDALHQAALSGALHGAGEASGGRKKGDAGAGDESQDKGKEAGTGGKAAAGDSPSPGAAPSGGQKKPIPESGSRDTDQPRP